MSTLLFQEYTFKWNNEFINKDDQAECEIINKNHKQYSVEIDGVSYPQYLYLNQNKSINFECLNKNEDIKVILAWNKWYGEANFGYGTGKVNYFFIFNFK